MKKKYGFTVMDESAKCEVCRRPIKKRLVEQKTVHKPTKCYKHRNVR